MVPVRSTRGRILFLSLFFSLVSFSSVVVVACPALACPAKDLGDFGAVPYNSEKGCSKVKWEFNGDSITWGIGDAKKNLKNYNKKNVLKRLAGEPLRVQKKFSNITVTHSSYPGMTTRRFIKEFKSSYVKQKKTFKLVKYSDVCHLLLGVNDYWDKVSPGMVVRNLKRIVKLFRKDVGCFVVVGTLIIPDRSYQAPFAKAVNNVLLTTKHDFPVIRYDQKISTNLLGDTLHPTPQGYDKMTNLFVKFMKQSGYSKMSSERFDTDGDGIYDSQEEGFYGTDPLLVDSDDDGVSDGDEVLLSDTDPLDPLSF